MRERLESDSVNDGKVEELKVLLAENAELANEPCSDLEYPPILIAAARNHPACIEALIEAGASATVNASGPRGMSGLHYAAEEGYARCMELLIGAGARMEAQDERGRTALMLSCREGKATAARALIEHGASLNHGSDDGYTAAMLATSRAHVECLRALIEAGADLHAKNNKGLTALDLAKSVGSVACLELLEEALREQVMEAPWKQSFKLMR